MSRPAFIPSVPEIAREAIIVVAGAVLAAVVVGLLPAEWKAWLKAQWSGVPTV